MDRIRPEYMNEIGRRESLAYLGKLIALVVALRHSFLGRSVLAHSEAPRPTTENNTLPTPEAEASSETEKALQKMIVLDVGKIVEGKVEPLSTVDAWKFYGGEQMTKEQVDSFVTTPSPDHLKLLILKFNQLSSHGNKVLESLMKAVESLTESRNQELPEFVSISAEDNGALLHIADKGDYFESEEVPEGEVVKVKKKGKKFTATTAKLSEQAMKISDKIVSCSFQMGTLQVAVMTEWGSTVNHELDPSEIQTLLSKFTNCSENYFRNGFSDPNAKFIFPPGASEENIKSITVTVEGEETPKEYTFNSEKWNESLNNSASSISITTDPDENRPKIDFLIVLNDGSEIEGKSNPTESDYTYKFQESNSLEDAVKLWGAYHPENPQRVKNLNLMKEFLREHPNQFFVFALGNNGDHLTATDLSDMPQNAIFVGQVIHSDAGGSIYSGTVGETRGDGALFIDTKEVGVEGLGSSHAVPIMSFIISRLFVQDDVMPTRDEVVAKLNKGDCIKSTPLMSTEITPPEVHELNLEKIRVLFSPVKKRPSYFSRRSLFHGLR